MKRLVIISNTACTVLFTAAVVTDSLSILKSTSGWALLMVVTFYLAAASQRSIQLFDLKQGKHH